MKTLLRAAIAGVLAGSACGGTQSPPAAPVDTTPAPPTPSAKPGAAPIATSTSTPPMRASWSEAIQGGEGDKSDDTLKSPTDKNCCRGKNDCKGRSGCRGPSNACSGQNACKGTGTSCPH